MAKRKDGALVKIARQTEKALGQGRRAAEGTNVIGGIRAGTASILGIVGGLISGCGRFVKPENDDDEYEEVIVEVKRKPKKKKAKRKTVDE